MSRSTYPLYTHYDHDDDYYHDGHDYEYDDLARDPRRTYRRREHEPKYGHTEIDFRKDAWKGRTVENEYNPDADLEFALSRPWYMDPQIIKYKKERFLKKREKFNEYMSRTGEFLINNPLNQCLDPSDMVQKIIRFGIVLIVIYLLFLWIRRDSQQQSLINNLQKQIATNPMSSMNQIAGFGQFSGYPVDRSGIPIMGCHIGTPTIPPIANPSLASGGCGRCMAINALLKN